MSAFYFSKTFSVVYNIVYIFLLGKWAFLSQPKGWHLPAHYFCEMFNKLFEQYNNIDAVAEYIGIHQECSEYMVRSGHNMDTATV